MMTPRDVLQEEMDRLTARLLALSPVNPIAPPRGADPMPRRSRERGGASSIHEPGPAEGASRSRDSRAKYGRGGACASRRVRIPGRHPSRSAPGTPPTPRAVTDSSPRATPQTLQPGHNAVITDLAQACQECRWLRVDCFGFLAGPGVADALRERHCFAAPSGAAVFGPELADK